MRFPLFSAAFFLIVAFSPPSRPSVERREARSAYILLNKIRQNPRAYQQHLGLPRGTPVTRRPLKWNETLARVAEARALDMAKRNYFDHTDPDGLGPNYYINRAGYTLNPDWLKRKSANNFESIGANHPTAIAGIEAMIRGSVATRYGHRKHLLGQDEWNASLQDIGIGYVRIPSGSTYRSYLCVIIAKHNW